ncbi:MAG: SMP-30/gluconolactonase/LRE family protein [Labilithrix sp.]|nr:SMP-30/gluconolactonase/LRE family protein [Labilithrix sp.]MBX3220756.1 SMP-30/gluconolactonase/LRE family protein [Labilithrix sp.]
MKRILPLLLVLTLGATAFGCKGKSKDDDKNPGDPANPGGEQPGANEPGAPTAEDRTTNPIEGIEPPTAILEAGAFTDGPAWHAGKGVLYFSTPLGDGALFHMLPDGRVLKDRDGVSAQGTQPIGNTVNAAGELVTVEAKRVVRQAAEGGNLDVIAINYSNAPAPAPAPGDAGAPASGDGQFDTLNDVVARKDGTLYVTDPGYFATPTANRIYRIDPAGKVQVVEAFDSIPRPNGIALSPDEKTLYVGFTAPLAGTLPFVRKYIVNEDGTLGEWTKFVDVGPENSEPDGLAVDKVGNVYVATKAGVEVYKPDGNPWGTVPIPEKPTGLAFGGEDLKTLYITTGGEKIWQLKTKLAGIAQ